MTWLGYVAAAVHMARAIEALHAAGIPRPLVMAFDYEKLPATERLAWWYLNTATASWPPPAKENHR